MTLKNDLFQGKEKTHTGLKNELKRSSTPINDPSKYHEESKFKRFFRGLLIVAFLGIFFIFSMETLFDSSETSWNTNTVTEAVSSATSGYSQSLLSDMGEWMDEMGYNLSQEQLVTLRDNGITATYTSRMRDLGYAELPFETLIDLGKHDVSYTFAAMMKELGYDLTVDELIQLRQHNVTAHFSSNMHDLGYTNITADELTRLRNVSVDIDLVEDLIDDQGSNPTVDEIIRYRISNQ